MSVVISLSEARAETAPAPVAKVHGIGRIAFSSQDGETRLKDLYQHDPLRILFPHRAPDDIASAVFVTTSGGLVGGDVLEMTGHADVGACVQMTAQAAEKVYRSNGADCHIDVDLGAGEGAWLEWLPQETIAFDGARMVRRTRADVAPGGSMLAGEFLVLGRTAMGEKVQSGLICDEWEIRRDGRLVWADALRLDGDIAETVSHPGGLAGATAMATVVYVADDAPEKVELARELLEANQDVRVGVTAVNGILVVRFLGTDGFTLRATFGDFWAAFRHEVQGLPNQLPRIWHI